MRNFIKQNPWFFAGLFVAVLFGLLLVNGLGFLRMIKHLPSDPERLRDVTFSIWDHYSFAKHGFLVFYSMKDFEAGIAYSNHSSVYLFFMYPFYMLEKLIPQLPMRAVVANLEMVLGIMAVVYVSLDGWKEKIKFHHGVLVILGVLFYLTMPGFWISAGKFNVDNPYHFLLPVLLLVAYRLSQGIVSGIKLWLPLGVLCLAVPLISSLLAFYLMVSSIRSDGMDKKLFSLGRFVFLLSVAVYLQPVIVSKMLGFTSSNSGWLFRSGLDGHTDYFTNLINSIISPYFTRPTLLLVIPVTLLMAQLVYVKYQNFTAGSAKILHQSYFGNSNMFYGVVFSPYLITCLFWPQAVSIHPYLYDYLLLAPICVWVVMNFSHSVVINKHPIAWVWLMMFLISFNLQQIAQAGRCLNCYYPL